MFSIAGAPPAHEGSGREADVFCGFNYLQAALEPVCRSRLARGRSSHASGPMSLWEWHRRFEHFPRVSGAKPISPWWLGNGEAHAAW